LVKPPTDAPKNEAPPGQQGRCFVRRASGPGARAPSSCALCRQQSADPAAIGEPTSCPRRSCLSRMPGSIRCSRNRRPRPLILVGDAAALPDGGVGEGDKVEGVADRWGVAGPSWEEKSVEAREAGLIGSTSSSSTGESWRIFGGAADHALRSPRTSP
jgi:hypothetical protein